MTEEIKTKVSTEGNTEDSRPRYSRDSRPPRENREGGYSSSYGEGDDRGRGGMRSKMAKKKVCRFCTETITVDYKNVRVLKSFVTERSKIVPARITGTCAIHQRLLNTAIKRARHLALLPYTSNHWI
jgi:small subunit ribosomal protein S18